MDSQGFSTGLGRASGQHPGVGFSNSQQGQPFVMQPSQWTMGQNPTGQVQPNMQPMGPPSGAQWQMGGMSSMQQAPAMQQASNVQPTWNMQGVGQGNSVQIGQGGSMQPIMGQGGSMQMGQGGSMQPIMGQGGSMQPIMGQGGSMQMGQGGSMQPMGQGGSMQPIMGQGGSMQPIMSQRGSMQPMGQGGSMQPLGQGGSMQMGQGGSMQPMGQGGSMQPIMGQGGSMQPMGQGGSMQPIMGQGGSMQPIMSQRGSMQPMGQGGSMQSLGQGGSMQMGQGGSMQPMGQGGSMQPMIQGGSMQPRPQGGSTTTNLSGVQKQQKQEWFKLQQQRLQTSNVSAKVANPVDQLFGPGTTPASVASRKTESRTDDKSEQKVVVPEPPKSVVAAPVSQPGFDVSVSEESQPVTDESAFDKVLEQSLALNLDTPPTKKKQQFKTSKAASASKQAPAAYSPSLQSRQWNKGVDELRHLFTTEDDFGDFSSANPAAVTSHSTGQSEVRSSDDFGAFQQPSGHIQGGFGAISKLTNPSMSGSNTMFGATNPPSVGLPIQPGQGYGQGTNYPGVAENPSNSSVDWFSQQPPSALQSTNQLIQNIPNPESVSTAIPASQSTTAVANFNQTQQGLGQTGTYIGGTSSLSSIALGGHHQTTVSYTATGQSTPACTNSGLPMFATTQGWSQQPNTTQATVPSYFGQTVASSASQQPVGKDSAVAIPGSWLQDMDALPMVYQEVYKRSSTPGSVFLDTAVVTEIFGSSNLPRSVLKDIWNEVNKSYKGKLLREEMVAALALIALAQGGIKTLTHDALLNLTHAPSPQLSAVNLTASSDAQVSVSTLRNVQPIPSTAAEQTLMTPSSALKCLGVCWTIVHSTVQLLSTASMPTLDEIVASSEGKEKLLGVNEIFKVAARVALTFPRNEDIQKKNLSIANEWKATISKFEVIHKVVEQAAASSSAVPLVPPACGLCSASSQVAPCVPDVMSFEGSTCHVVCVNFWNTFVAVA